MAFLLSCACAVASHYDAVSVGAEEIFVFIISTEKPQAVKPKAIMKKRILAHSKSVTVSRATCEQTKGLLRCKQD